jgi:predicted neutral ceramidase superfamily lipid hydrolase
MSYYGFTNSSFHFFFLLLLKSCASNSGDLFLSVLGEGWGVVSLNICHREVNTRDDNKISRQCICASAWSCLNRICAASSRISIDVCFVLIQVITNPMWLMSPLVIVACFFLLLALVCTSILNVYKICLVLKYGIRITRIFPTFSCKNTLISCKRGLA